MTAKVYLPKQNVVLISLFSFFGLLLSMALVVADDKPGWIESDPGEFPNDQYLTATGSAGKLEVAKDRALANLVKIIELHISESSTTRSDIEVQIKQGDETFSKSHQLSEQISIQTDKVINGARIVASWEDEETRVFHALAVLDRQQAANNIRHEMQRLDDETETELKHAESVSDSLLSMSALDKALLMQQQRLSLQDTLKVIDRNGRGHPAEWNLAELRGRLEQKLQQLKISTAVDHDPMGELERLLKSAMGNAGFPATDETPDFVLVTSLDVQDLGLREGWYWLRAKLTLSMIQANGKIRGSQEWPLKVSALQRNDAESRLMTQVSRTLNLQLKSAIIAFATGVE